MNVNITLHAVKVFNIFQSLLNFLVQKNKVNVVEVEMGKSPYPGLFP